MKRLIKVIIFTLLSTKSYTQCTNTSSWGSGNAPIYNDVPLTISTCTYRGEYNTVNNVVAGETYTSTLTCNNSNLYITIHQGTYNGTVVSYGNSPLTWTAISNGTHYIHYNTNSSCGTNGSNCCTTIITCNSCPSEPITPNNCLNGITICDDLTLNGNSSGYGTQELTNSNDGCLSTEHQSSWYFMEFTSSGTLSFSITPSNGTDDYDFAVWGPYSTPNPTIICPPNTNPIRCSYAAGGGNTGIGNGGSGTSEGVFGDGWVSSLNVLVGEIYIIVVDNYSSTTSPFTMDITLTNGATLNCTPLPVTLLDFDGYPISNKKSNYLYWSTETEINNDYFTLERSLDMDIWTTITQIKGGGNTNTLMNYSYIDNNPPKSITYYRLKQTDFDGNYEYFEPIVIKNENIVSTIYSGKNINLSSIQNYQIWDITGRLVKNGSSDYINTGDLSSGVYIIRFGQYTEKFIVK